MHVRVRLFGHPEAVVNVTSKLTRIEEFRGMLKDKYGFEPNLFRLLYGGKLLEDGYTFHDYNIKLNDVIQIMISMVPNQTVKEEQSNKHETNGDSNKEEQHNNYQDAESVLYAIGDLVDMNHRELGAWFEGKIIRIVHDPKATATSDKLDVNKKVTSSTPSSSQELSCKKDHLENGTKASENSTPKMGIEKYFFTKSQMPIQEEPKTEEVSQNLITDQNLLYIVQRDDDDYGAIHHCKLNEIRPRARIVLDIQELKEDLVMVNHNIEQPMEKGYWYDFKIQDVNTVAEQGDKYCQLVGTLFAGPQVLENLKLKVQDKIYAIESVVPLAERSVEYSIRMITPTKKRSILPICMNCLDDNDLPCQDCGCYVCSGKENPDKIILCDECGLGFHLDCLSPVLTEVPDDDWYCATCKRNPDEVVAPGGAKQTKKSTKSVRDWGRGMACVGKTKTCAMPANHFGPIPGVEVGMSWLYRIQLSETGVHRPPVSGIHGRDKQGAYSLVLSGGYEDDEDNGNEFTYTGSGGRDLSGNRRTAGQSHDQTLTRENRALARNCAVSDVSEEGADAGGAWRAGKPVRVVRSFKMQNHFPKYAPKEGLRYDGIYKVVKYYPETGRSGFRVWKYLLRRDDPSAAPWEPGATQFSIVYPDGYLEAEAEKKKLKGKSCPNSAPKRTRKRESSQPNQPRDTEEPPRKKSLTNKAAKKKQKGEKSGPKSVPKTAAVQKSDKTSEEASDGEADTSQPGQHPDKDEPPPKKGRGRPPKTKRSLKSPTCESESAAKLLKPSPRRQQAAAAAAAACRLTAHELQAINADALNAALWNECVDICDTRGMRDFVEHVTQVFKCIICQEVIVRPVTTPCLHNFCFGCMKRALKNAEGQAGCPCCRRSLALYQPETNEPLQTALRTVLPGYDAGK